jgi:hypothetical protein
MAYYVTEDLQSQYITEDATGYYVTDDHPAPGASLSFTLTVNPGVATWLRSPSRLASRRPPQPQST